MAQGDRSSGSGGPATSAEPNAFVGSARPVAAEVDVEVVADAPVGTCDDLDSFVVPWTLLQSLRLVLVPLVAMALAGLLLVMASDQAIWWTEWGIGAPLLDRVVPGPPPD